MYITCLAACDDVPKVATYTACFLERNAPDARDNFLLPKIKNKKSRLIYLRQVTASGGSAVWRVYAYEYLQFDILVVVLNF